MNPEQKSHFFAKIPSMAIFLAFAFEPPLGVLLFILRNVDRKKQQEEQARWRELNRREQTARYNAAAANAAPRREAASEPVSGAPVDHPTDEQRKSKKNHETLTTVLTVVGAILVLAGFGGVIDFIDFVPYTSSVLRLIWNTLLPALAQAFGGAGMLTLGLRARKLRKLEIQLDRVVGQRDNIPLDELFAAAAVPYKEGRKAVEQAIDHGYFGAGAYIDNRTGYLIVRGPAPQPEQRREAPAPQRDPSAESEYERFLRLLREANDAIPDPVMTAKISRLETLTARIFQLADQHPEKRQQLQKFMDYYLPTSLKLLNSYAQLSHGDMQGQNINEVRRSVEHSMDLLVSAFEKQLDKLYQTDVLDISSDVAALQGMLNLDGLTDEADVFRTEPDSPSLKL